MNPETTLNRFEEPVSADKFAMITENLDWDPAVTYAEQIIASHRGPGGRKPGPITYTIKALLVGAACLISTGRTPSLRRIQRLLLFGLTHEQRDMVGMTVADADTTPLQTSRRRMKLEYSRFCEWVNRHLRWFDPHADIPAHKITNGEYQQILDARTDTDRAAADAAWVAAHTLVNLIVAGSVCDPRPVGYEGDLVADETIYDVSKMQYGDGRKAHLRRAAVPMAALYRRQEGVVSTGSPDPTVRERMAWGIGVTALVRVGAPGSIRSVSPLTIAVAFGPPSPGSVDAVETCLTHADANGLTVPAVVDEQRSRRRPPFFTTDMGYNSRNGWAELMHGYGYNPIGRYPRNVNVVSHLEPARGDDISPGPIQAHGALYCPAALDLATPPLVRRGRDIAADGNEQHDDRLATLLPMLMGTNSRVRTAAARPGRPKTGEARTKVYKVDLVCPAVQGRVRCPLKPESMAVAASQAPTVAPAWSAEAKRCCLQSQVTVTLSERQFKQLQPGLPPGSWEHTFLYEAYRSLNERTFSMYKSPHISNTQAMNWGPRRDPMIMINLALCAAVTNVELQWTWRWEGVDAAMEKKIDSVQQRFAKLEEELGRTPTRVPPRT